MEKVLIIWQMIPESIDLYIIDVKEKSFMETLELVSGNYAGLVDCDKQAEIFIQHLSEILTQVPKVDESRLVDFDGKVCCTGVML